MASLGLTPWLHQLKLTNPHPAPSKGGCMGVSPALQLNLLFLFRGYQVIASFLSFKGFKPMTDRIKNEKEAMEQLPRMLEDLFSHPENFNRLLKVVETPLTIINGGKQND